jgi:arylsulfatase A-like enzyme
LIGRILSTARARDDWHETIVVFTSDHGFSEGQHRYWGKHNMWDASLHVPLILRLPGEEVGRGEVGRRKAGRGAGRGSAPTVLRITEHLDIYPSLCELAGLPVPPHCEGRSAVPLLGSLRPAETSAGCERATEDALTWPDRAISHRKHMWHDRLQVYCLASSIRSPRYRYTEYLDPDGGLLGEELFDYETDPNETVNHVREPGYAQARDELSELLHREMVRSGARGGGERLPRSRDGFQSHEAE